MAAKFGQTLGSTYQEDVRHDIMFLCPFMIRSLSSAGTIADYAFPQHHPLYGVFQLDVIVCLSVDWKLPQLLTPEQRDF